MTTLKEQLHLDLTVSIRAKDSLTSGTLRMVLAAITNEEVSGKEARVLTEQDLTNTINETILRINDAKRPELADKERAELKIIQGYLPAELSASQLEEIIAAAVLQAAADGATGPSAMGAVMKLVSPQVAGRADGTQVAAAVKSALS